MRSAETRLLANSGHNPSARCEINLMSPNERQEKKKEWKYPFL